jgi:hypothetical protein
MGCAKRGAANGSPLASRATKQTARKAPSLRVAVKCGVCGVALLGFVVRATTFVARLASIRILPATQSAEDLIKGSLVTFKFLAPDTRRICARFNYRFGNSCDHIRRSSDIEDRCHDIPDMLAQKLRIHIAP